MSNARARLRPVISAVITFLVMLAGLALGSTAPAYAAVTSFACSANTIYSVRGDDPHTIYRVDPSTGTNSTNGAFDAGKDDAVNALALPAGGGRYLYAFNRTQNRILRFDANSEDTTSWSAPANSNAGSVIAGAIDPATNVYYYAVGGSPWKVYAFDIATSSALGQVATISGLSTNGDMAFDASGNLYVVSNSGASAAGTLARIEGPLPRTAGSTAYAATSLAGLPADSGQYASMAFDGSGVLVIGTGSGQILRINPTNGALLSTKTTSLTFSDMASCAAPSTARVQVNLPDGRFAPGDQFTVTLTGSGVTSGNTGTTAGTDAGLQNQTGELAGPVVVLPSTTYTITQSPASGTNPANYVTTWKCVKDSDGSTIATGTGSPGTFTMPATSGASAICTFTNTPLFPAIELDKTASVINDLDGNGADAGDTVTYAFKVTNTGQTTLSAVTVSDGKVGAVTCPVGTLAVGASLTCTPKSYTITQADVNAGKVDNTATAEGTSPSGVKVTDPDTVSTTIPSTPAIDLVKTASAVNDVDTNGADAGDTITYSFTLTNRGNVALNPVTVSDTKVGTVTCPSGALAPGASVSCTQKTYTITQADVNAGKVDNTATAEGTAPNGVKVSDADSVTTSVPASPAVELVKTASAVNDADNNGHDLGDKITYSFRVTNKGNVTLNPVTVTDAKVGVVTCPAGPLAPGASLTCTPKDYLLTQADINAGKVDNTATAEGTTPNGAKVSDPDSVSTPLAISPGVEIDKIAGAVTDLDANGPDAGDTITFRFEVSNIGNVTLNPVSVSDPKVGAVSCPSGALAPGATVSCTNKVHTLLQSDINAGRFENTATAEGTAPNGTKVGDSDSTLTQFVGAPAIELDKTAGAISDADANGADAGDTITYGFKVTNVGNVSLNPVTVSDPRLGVISCPAGALAPGASLTCTSKVYALTQADVDSGKVDNTATAEGTAPNGTKVADPDSVSTTIAANAAIELDKTGSSITDVDTNGPDAGDTITYSFKVTNVGNVTLSAIGVGDPKLGSIVCPVGPLAPGASLTCTPKNYTLTQADVDAGRVDNTATASGRSPANVVVTDPDSITTPVPVTAAIGLDKTASTVDDLDGNGTDAGDKVTYSFKLTNLGNVALSPVTVTDPMVGPVTCPSGSVAPGASVTCTDRTYTITQADVNAGKVDNTAVGKGTAPNGTQVTDSDSVSTVIPASPAIAFDKTASAVGDSDSNGADVGDTITFSFRVTNAGNVPLDPVTVSDPMLGAISCPTGSLAPGASVSCTPKAYALTQADVTAGKVENTARATGTSPRGDKVTADDSTLTGIASRPALELKKTAGSVIDSNGNGPDAGDTITFSFKVTNTGNVPLSVLTINDPLVGIVSCPGGDLAPGAVATCTPKTYTITQDEVNAGTVVNTATASGTAPDGVVVTDSDSTTTPLPARPALELDKTASAIDDVDGNGPDAGDTITYSFVVTNTGNLPLSDIKVSDPKVGPVTCPAGTLPAGGQLACGDATYTLTQADVSAGQVKNTATATGRAPAGGTVTDGDSTTTPVVGTTADIVVRKSVDKASPRVGDVVTYALEVSNTGDAAAQDVVIVDVLPDGVTFMSADAPCTESGGTVSCNLGSIAAGASRSVDVTAKVDPLEPAVAAHQHLLDVQKAEVHVDLEPDETKTVTVGCQTGYLVTDGSGRIDHVDQGTGTVADVRILESRAVGLDTWQVSMVNESTGRAQGKAFAVCVKQETENVEGHTHQVVLGDVVTRTAAVSAGTTEVTAACAAGQTPAQPGFQLDGTGDVATSYPSAGPAGTNGWTWVVRVEPGDTAVNGTFTLRCLGTEVSSVNGHSHDLDLGEVRQTVTVPAGQTLEFELRCAGDAKGIVAGFAADAGLVVLGNDPRPVIRVFKFHNPTSGPLSADLYLLCLSVRNKGGVGNGGVIVNTARATTTTSESDSGNNSDTARIEVDTSAPASPASTVVAVAGSTATTAVTCASGGAACTGVARLVAVKAVKVSGTTIKRGAVLAQGSFRIASGKTVQLKLKQTAAGKKALRSKAVKRAQLAIGSQTKIVRIKR